MSANRSCRAYLFAPCRRVAHRRRRGSSRFLAHRMDRGARSLHRAAQFDGRSGRHRPRWRLVPAADPARRLVRGRSTEGGGVVPDGAHSQASTRRADVDGPGCRTAVGVGGEIELDHVGLEKTGASRWRTGSSQRGRSGVEQVPGHRACTRGEGRVLQLGHDLAQVVLGLDGGGERVAREIAAGARPDRVAQFRSGGELRG